MYNHIYTWILDPVCFCDFAPLNSNSSARAAHTHNLKPSNNIQANNNNNISNHHDKQRQHQQHNDEYQHTETTPYSHTIYVTEAHQSRSLTCQTDSLCLVWLDLLASVGMALAWFGSILFTTGHPILWLRFSYIFYFSLQHNHFRNYSSVSQYRVLGCVLSVHNMQYGCVFFYSCLFILLYINLLLSHCHGHFPVTLVLFMRFCM